MFTKHVLIMENFKIQGFFNEKGILYMLRMAIFMN